MTDQQLCNLCNTEPASDACLCDSKITLLGKSCFLSHIQDATVSHDMIDISLGLSMRSDPELIDRYFSEAIEVAKVINCLKRYETKTLSFLKELETSKKLIFNELELNFSHTFNIFKNVQEELQAALRIMTSYKRTLCSEGSNIIELFKRMGEKGIIHHYYASFTIFSDEALKFIRNLIYLGDSSIIERSEESFFKSYDELFKAYETDNINKQKLIDVLRNEITEKENRYHELQNLFTNSELKTAEVVKELNDVKDKLSKSEFSVKAFKKKETLLKSDLAKMEELKKDLEEAKKNAEMKINSQADRIKALETEVLLLEGNLKRAQDGKKSLEDSLLKSNSEITKLKDLLSKTSEKQLEAEKSLKDLRGKIKTQEAKVIKLQRENKQLEDYRAKNELVIQSRLERKQKLKLSSSFDRVDHYQNFRDKRYIYMTVNGIKSLIQHDVYTKSIEIINLNSLARHFYATSTCVLPNSDVFIAGFGNPVSSEAYLYTSSSRDCIKLPDLFTARYFIALFYWNDSVYAFGGFDGNDRLNVAERFNLTGNSWEKLPNMKYQRESLSCVGLNDKIYLFCGGKDSIEMFSTTTLTYQDVLIPINDPLDYSTGIASMIEERIYLITNKSLQVFDLNLTKVEERINCWNYKTYSINNIVKHKGNIYFYNYHTFLIEKFSTTSLSYKSKPHSTSHYAKNLSKRYLYKTRDNTKSLHQIDVKYKKTEVLDLSKTLNRNFCSSSICMLPNGDIMIAGFKNPLSSECYVYEIGSKSCVKIAELGTARYWIALVCHECVVYAFGGRVDSGVTIKTAEAYDLTTKRWNSLPDMKHPRHLAYCVGLENMVYIFAGGIQSIEEFNIETGSYKVLSVGTDSFYAISVMHNDLIYVIGDSNYKILNKDLEVLEEEKNNWHKESLNYLLGNLVVYHNTIYFYNNGEKNLESFDTLTLKRESVIVNR
jgi:hypothetical protein